MLEEDLGFEAHIICKFFDCLVAELMFVVLLAQSGDARLALVLVLVCFCLGFEVRCRLSAYLLLKQTAVLLVVR